METNNITPNNQNNGRATAGIIILVIGSILLIRQMDWFFFPHWLFSWPMWMIGYGVYVGGKHNFRKPVWIWLVVLGAAFLITQNVPNSGQIVFPASIIAVGAWMITKHNNRVAQAQPGGSYTDYKEVK